MPASVPRLRLPVGAFISFLAVTACARLLSAAPPEWPQWRGPQANGVSPDAHPPVTWNETNHVRWKLSLPGKSHSSPIVTGHRVYLMSAAPVGDAQPPVFDSAPGVHDSVPVTHRHEYAVIAVNRADGRIAWKTVVREEWPHEGGHTTGSPASNSPVTDGAHVYADFGSRGLYCLDLDGRVVWKRDLGRLQTLHAHGEGSVITPALRRHPLPPPAQPEPARPTGPGHRHVSG